MLSSVSHNPGLVYNYRTAVLSSLLVIPIAIEIIRIAYRCYKDPDLPKKCLQHLKAITVDGLLPRKGEPKNLYYRRAARNALKLGFFILLFSAAILLPLILFPPGLALPASIIAFFTVFHLVDKREVLFGRVKKCKEWFQGAFKRKQKEGDIEFRNRVIKNAAIIAGITLVVAGLIGGGVYMHILANSGYSIWGLVDGLPFQTPLVVFSEYFLMATMHFYKGVQKIKEGSYIMGGVHILTGMLGVIFPFFYAFKASPELRLHHSFIGLIFQLLPFASFQFLGTMITLDSFLYATPFRLPYQNYDIMNVIVKHFSMILVFYSIAMMLQYTLQSTTLRRQKLEEIQERRKKHNELEMEDVGRDVIRQKISKQGLPPPCRMPPASPAEAACCA